MFAQGLLVEESEIRIHGSDHASHPAESILCRMPARNNRDPSARGRGKIVPREGRIGDGLGLAPGILHIGDQAHDFVRAPVSAEVLADGAVFTKQRVCSFFIEHQRQRRNRGSGGDCRLCINALIALVEFAPGQNGLIQDGKIARSDGLFDHFLLYRRRRVSMDNSKMKIWIPTRQIGGCAASAKLFTAGALLNRSGSLAKKACAWPGV